MQAARQNTADQGVTRLADGRWARGRSGNPGGRPKTLVDVRDLARTQTELAVATLAQIAEHGVSEMARIAAANSLLDRGWGKPPVALELRQPEPKQIIELLVEAERHTRELLAAPLAITGPDGSPNQGAPPVRCGRVEAQGTRLPGTDD